MASTLIGVPSQYGYVLLSTIACGVVGILHGTEVSGLRKKSGVKLPNTYATDEEAKQDPLKMKFNCAQRAHANYVENVSFTLATSLSSGLIFPKTSAALLAVWSISRYIYMKGYASGDPKSRYRFGGGIHWFCLLGLAGLSGFAGFRLLTTKIPIVPII